MNIFNETNGFDAMITALPKTFFSFTQPSAQAVFGNFLALLFGNMLNSFSATITFGAKTIKTARTGIIIASIVMALFSFIPVTIGLAAKIFYPDISASLAFSVMSTRYGDGMYALLAMAITAAIFSSGPACLLMASNTLTQDVFKVLKPAATEKQSILFSRWIIVVCGVAAIFMGTMATSVLSNFYGAFQITAVSGVVLLLSLVWKRINSTSAFWSILVGSIVAAVWHFIGRPFDISPFWPSMLVTFCILIPVTLASKNEVSNGYARYAEARKKMKNIKEA